MDQSDDLALLIRHDAAVDWLNDRDTIADLRIDNQVLHEMLSVALAHCHALTCKVNRQQTTIRTLMGLDDDASRQGE